MQLRHLKLAEQGRRWEKSKRPTSRHSWWRGPHHRSCRIESIGVDGRCLERTKVSSPQCCVSKTGESSSSSRSSSRASSASSTNSNRYLELEIFVSRSSDSGHGLRECPQARLDQCLQAPARLAVVESLSSSTRDWTTASAMIVNGFCHAPSRV